MKTILSLLCAALLFAGSAHAGLKGVASVPVETPSQTFTYAAYAVDTTAAVTMNFLCTVSDTADTAFLDSVTIDLIK